MRIIKKIVIGFIILVAAGFAAALAKILAKDVWRYGYQLEALFLIVLIAAGWIGYKLWKRHQINKELKLPPWKRPD
jgi:hypothetical protein